MKLIDYIIVDTINRCKGQKSLAHTSKLLMKFLDVLSSVNEQNQEVYGYPVVDILKKITLTVVPMVDTLSKIASEYDLNLEELMELNQLSETIIHPGERLIVKQ